MNHPDVSKWLCGIEKPFTNDNIKEWLKVYQQDDFPVSGFTLRDADNVIIGFGGLELSSSQQSAEATVFLQASEHGFGKCFDLSRMVMLWGFTKLDLLAIYTRVMKENKVSRRCQNYLSLSQIRDLPDGRILYTVLSPALDASLFGDTLEQ